MVASTPRKIKWVVDDKWRRREEWNRREAAATAAVAKGEQARDEGNDEIDSEERERLWLREEKTERKEKAYI